LRDSGGGEGLGCSSLLKEGAAKQPGCVCFNSKMLFLSTVSYSFQETAGYNCLYILLFLSYLIREGNLNILFDVGYSDLLIRNAQKMNISLRDVDFIVISHGHIDHTGGLEPLIKYYTEAASENIPHRPVTLVAHPLAFDRKQKEKFADIGPLIPVEKLALYFQFNLSQKPLWLSDQLVFLGEIERTNDFEAQESKKGARQDFIGHTSK
jgi:7,8-dihydropterin-6-yl-methyl-4-(beta-D-ribofuranosyl)aminobenzene 5'-phosphate synthase